MLGIDEGTLVKCGATVRVAVLDAIEGDDLETLRDEVVKAFKAAGFTYVALDLQGYRSGSMNEVAV